MKAIKGTNTVICCGVRQNAGEPWGVVEDGSVWFTCGAEDGCSETYTISLDEF